MQSPLFATSKRCLRRLTVPLLLAVAFTVAGCSALTGPSARQRHTLSLLKYPGSAKLGKNLDIVAVRHGGWVDLVNRTDQPLHHVQLWINQQYVRQVKTLAIGTGNHYPLDSFVNQHEQSFPTGTLLAPEKSADLVLVEVYNPRTDRRDRLVVQNPMQINKKARGRGTSEQNTSSF